MTAGRRLTFRRYWRRGFLLSCASCLWPFGASLRCWNSLGHSHAPDVKGSNPYHEEDLKPVKQYPPLLAIAIAASLAAWSRARENIMLWTLIALFLILWLLGFGFSLGGSLIHLLLVAALLMLVVNLIQSRRWPV